MKKKYLNPQQVEIKLVHELMQTKSGETDNTGTQDGKPDENGPDYAPRRSLWE